MLEASVVSMGSQPGIALSLRRPRSSGVCGSRVRELGQKRVGIWPFIKWRENDRAK